MILHRGLYIFPRYMLDVMDNLCLLDILDDNLVVYQSSLRYTSMKDFRLLDDIHCMVRMDWAGTVESQFLYPVATQSIVKTDHHSCLVDSYTADYD